jgi:RNA polymerase sigma-70 factor (ECF subfamily)
VISLCRFDLGRQEIIPAAVLNDPIESTGRPWNKGLPAAVQRVPAGFPAWRDTVLVDADRELVEQAAAGSRQAFDELVRRHQASIVSLARALTRGSADAEDIAQEVFVRAWRGLHGFRGDSAFRTWLHRVAVNVVHSHHGRLARLRRVFQAPAADAGGEDPIDRAADTGDLESDVVMRDAIDKALGSLPEDLRVAVTLRDMQGLDYREIAKVLGIPIGTVESRIFRGRQRLQPLLEPLRSRR